MTDEAKSKTVIRDMDGAVIGQASQALVLQTYAITLERQPIVDFGQETKLTTLQDQMNKALTGAKTNGDVYLSRLQKDAIGTITRVDRYFNMQRALARLVDKRPERSILIHNLRGMEDQALSFKGEADDLSRELSSLRSRLSDDAAQFERCRFSLHELVESDHGLIRELDSQMKDIDGKLGAAIAGAAVSGVAIGGGLFIMAVGGISGFVTGGVSMPLVLVGGVIVTGGIAGAVGSGVAIGALVNQKNEVLRRQTGLRTESKFAAGLESSFVSLAGGAAASAEAAQQMANAWTGLSGHLKNFADDLDAGRADEDMLDLYLSAAAGDVEDIKRDVAVISRQLAGAETLSDPKTDLETIISKAELLANDNTAARAAA